MTQAKLLDIAVREFGLNGLEGASTRGIAAAAGTAMSSITYHYGGKEGLYVAAADHIATVMAAAMAPALVPDYPIASDDRDGARSAIQRILARFVDRMARDATADASLFIMREQMNPTEAFDHIYAGLIGPIMERLVELVAIVTGHSDRSAAGVAALTLMGQAMAIRASRASVLRFLDLASLDAPTVAAVKARIQANADAILDAMIAERQDQI